MASEKLDLHRPTLFPTAWSRLVNKVVKEGATVRVRAASRASAMRLRLRFYTFRRSLHKNHHELASIADGVMATINGEEVVFAARDLNEEARLIEAAIEEAK